MTRMHGNKQRIRTESPLGSLILDILWTISDVTTAMGFEGPYQQVRRLHREALGVPEPKRWQYNQAIRYLKRDRDLEVIEKNNKLFLKLTKKGRLKVLLRKLAKEPRKKEKWDGKWRLIIWDIPEISSAQRNRLRAVIKDIGFYQLQKSVFISPYSIPRPAVDYLKESGLLKFIRFLRVDELDKDGVLKKHFGL